jgi:hypothetical protein
MRIQLVVLISLGLAGAAAAQQAPPRKPGLWKQTIASSMNGKPQPPVNSTICLDAKVDRAMSVFGAGMSQQVCTSNTVTRTPTGYRFSSVCQMAGGTIKSQGVGTGDFSSNYKVSMSSTTTGAPMASMNGTSSTNITASWAGACPAGQKPGDMVMPGGMKINVLSMAGAMGGR